MDHEPDLIFERVDGAWGERSAQQPGSTLQAAPCALAWCHLDADGPGVVARLEGAGLPSAAIEALLAAETRPRVLALPGGLVAVLRGVNLNPGADPEDMVALRLWVQRSRVISLSRRNLRAVGDLSEALRGGGDELPVDASSLVFELDRLLMVRMDPVIGALSDRVDTLEDEALDDTRPDHPTSGELAELRRSVIALRRHLAPQREALQRLGEGLTKAGIQHDSPTLIHLHDGVTRLVEELDELSQRLVVAQDLSAGQSADRMNRQMLMLSIVAAIFLPLGFLTGLLGINVGGMPGATNDVAFWLVCALLAILTALQVVVMRRLKFF